MARYPPSSKRSIKQKMEVWGAKRGRFFGGLVKK
jgi:hypothetical protein